MNLFQKWVASTIKDDDVKNILAIRLNKLNPIMREATIRSFIGKNFKGYHAHRNPRRNHAPNQKISLGV